MANRETFEDEETRTFRRETRELEKDLSDNLALLKRELGIGVSFDVLVREFKLGGRDAALILLDGFSNAELLTDIFQTLLVARREDLAPRFLEKVVAQFLPHIEAQVTSSVEEVVGQVLAGPVALLIDGEDQAVIIDTRTYPARTPSESDIERVTRGAKDSFVETMLFNVALVRRRIRDPKLRVEVLHVGTRSQADVAVLYLEDIANPDLVSRIKERIKEVKVDGLPMAEKSLVEFISPRNAYNPLPVVRYTERPDVAAINLLEGHVVIMVDTSPSAVITPSTVFHHLQHAEEFRQNPVGGTFLRWIRLLGVLAALFIGPLWLLAVLEPRILPESLKFIGPKETGNLPLVWQFVLAYIGVDLVRLATIHTPAPLSTALGFIGAVLIGQVATEVGIFVPEVLLYAAVAAIGVFVTPSFELGLAIRVMAIFLLVITGFLKLPGFLFGSGMLLLLFVSTRSFGVPYLWPLVPLEFGALKDLLFRKPVPLRLYRPSVLRPGDRTSQPNPEPEPSR